MYKQVYLVFSSANSVLAKHGYSNVNIGPWRMRTELKYLPPLLSLQLVFYKKTDQLFIIDK